MACGHNVGIGGRPKVAQAQAAGIVLGPTGAIAIDRQQRTNISGWQAQLPRRIRW
jgi:pyruvate/2-oxoglutarate dehydrogenase complex dihydrolipoamide dehydrogenase (E3) component